MSMTLPIKCAARSAADAFKVGRVRQAVVPRPQINQTLSFLEKTMWTKPEFTEMRFGFEVTMYIANR
jgi:coenzyme PQQ precursor peptide PqqA